MHSICICTTYISKHILYYIHVFNLTTNDDDTLNKVAHSLTRLASCRSRASSWVDRGDSSKGDARLLVAGLYFSFPYVSTQSLCKVIVYIM